MTTEPRAAGPPLDGVSPAGPPSTLAAGTGDAPYANVPPTNAPSDGLPASAGRTTVVAALCVGTFVAALGNSVVNAILPIVADGLQSDVASVQWVITTFLLVQSGLLLTFGRLGDMRGHKEIYMLGLVVLAVGSALCGLTTSVPMLVAARVVQAIGASMLVSNLAAIMTQVFPPEQRGRALGIQATTVYLGLALGAPLGGWLTDLFGWRSVFFVLSLIHI